MLDIWDKVCEAEEKMFDALGEAGIDDQVFINYRELSEKRIEAYVKNFVLKSIDQAFSAFYNIKLD